MSLTNIIINKLHDRSPKIVTGDAQWIFEIFLEVNKELRTYQRSLQVLIAKF